jgi:hypothetical protein
MYCGMPAHGNSLLQHNHKQLSCSNCRTNPPAAIQYVTSEALDVFAHLALALLVARGEKPIRLRGLLPKLSRSLAGYLLAPLKNLRHGEEESEPMVGLSPSLFASFLPLGVMMPLDEGGECAPASTSPARGLVAMGLRLGLMGGSRPAMTS